MSRNQDRSYPEGVLPTQADGNDWEEIKQEARRITNTPGGLVELDHYRYWHMGITKHYLERGDTASKSHYAYVVVTPPQKEDETVSLPEPPQGTYFRLEDLEQAFMDAGYAGHAGHYSKISRHLPRYSRPSGDYFTIEELKKAGEQVNGYRGVAGTSPEAFLDKASAQAAKNRVYDAFGKES